MTDPPDIDFPGYRVARVLLDGPDAAAYAATDPTAGRAVVIETLAGDAAGDEHLHDWFREAWEAVEGIDHPNVVDVYGVDERDGVPFAVRASLSGTDLGGLLEERGPLPPEVACALLARIADALDALHSAGVVHGSFGSESVIVEQVRGGGRPVLVGFGRVEGDRRDDTRALVPMLEAMIGQEPSPEMKAVLERGSDWEGSASMFAAACTEAAGGHVAGSKRRNGLLALAALVAVAAAVFLVTQLGGGDDDDSDVVASNAAETSATTESTASNETGDEPLEKPGPRVSATGEGTPAKQDDGIGDPIDVPGGPVAVAARRGVIYAATTDKGELVGYEERTDKASLEPIELGGAAQDLTIIDDVVWAALPDEGVVASVDLGDEDAEAEMIDVGGEPRGLVGALGSIWVAAKDSGELIEVDVASGDVERVEVDVEQPRGIAFGFGSLWVTDATGSVVEVDPRNPKNSESFKVGADPRGVLAVEDRVWVANSGDGTVSVLDPATGKGEELDVGGTPLDVAAGSERIWISNADGYVSSIDFGGTEVNRYDLPPGLGTPAGIAEGQRVWTSTGEGDSLVPVDPPR